MTADSKSIYSYFALFDKRYEGKTTFHIRSCSVTEIRDFRLLHHHDYNQIVYSFRSPFTHIYNGEEYEQDGGCMFFVPAMAAHKFEISESRNEEICQIDFSDDFIKTNQNSSNMEALFNMLYLDPVITNAQGVSPMLRFDGKRRTRIAV